MATHSHIAKAVKCKEELVDAIVVAIIEKIDAKIGVGVRMGGMGVAIGSLVGKELAELF